ncbi:hypothetical protein ACFFU8_09350 [Chromobacterium piscinae]|uniref:hypothetical protein n=1 Tax=Chromobacterium piscinae TaxID=686831 RepID=UPI001E2A5049|nr:hypothetical protein [Chromobacterium piscinae]MCD5327890.1 hypothetical protein [Chromobacterium piscinae]
MTQNISTRRAFAGIYVDGPQISVSVNPLANGQLSVTVTAHPDLTGFSQSCRLTNLEAVHEFSLSDITLAGETLLCMAPYESAPIYREGFTIQLDSGMAQALQPLLPKLANVARTAESIEGRVASLMAPDHISHMESFITQVVARVILDKYSPKDAITAEAIEHFAGKNAKFLEAFNDDQVQVHLANAQHVATLESLPSGISVQLAAEQEHSKRLADALRAMLEWHDDIAKPASQPLLNAGYEALDVYDISHR